MILSSTRAFEETFPFYFYSTFRKEPKFYLDAIQKEKADICWTKEKRTGVLTTILYTNNREMGNDYSKKLARVR